MGTRGPDSWRPVSRQDSGGLYNNHTVIQCSSSVFVSISVIDKPDLDPQFVREFYSASVAEDTPQHTWGRAWGELSGRERVWLLTVPPCREPRC